MSGKVEAPARKLDRRVRRTRDSLGDALLALMQEMAFTDITVQRVLNRAGISRSTFYEHYRGKDDLFLSDVEDFLEAMSTLLTRSRETSRRVAPVRELFAHVREMRQLSAAIIAADKMRDFLELAQGFFARGIERRLAEMPTVRAIDAGQRAAMAHAFAGALLSLMAWWINHRTSLSAENMDVLYHDMVWSGVSAAKRVPVSPDGAHRRRR